MSLKNYSNLLDNVYNYLGFKNIEKNNDIDELINECLKEIESLSSFNYRYQEFDYILDFLNKEPYLSFLNGCSGYYISVMTLGALIDNKIKYYSKTNLTKCLVFDACASAYLEYKSDEYEKTLANNLTYRFCPGYQGSSIEDIKYIFDILKPDKIGLELLESNLMIPQKSMAGIIGIGKNIDKSCKNCILEGNCKYVKEGMKCYQ
ncbi:MAG: hypothetical protein IJA65_00130 [Acholeplasmatales bacterium]|nr:hypothetical protein [Acholeplasmatales bacterium]